MISITMSSPHQQSVVSPPHRQRVASPPPRHHLLQRVTSPAHHLTSSPATHHPPAPHQHLTSTSTIASTETSVWIISQSDAWQIKTGRRQSQWHAPNAARCRSLHAFNKHGAGKVRTHKGETKTKGGGVQAVVASADGARSKNIWRCFRCPLTWIYRPPRCASIEGSS
jgi:hypothetical protein